MEDIFDLQRFVDAQQGVYASAIAELKEGLKRSHWMWFVFPQHKALGRSSMALRYGISSKAEARSYWQHVILGARLKECCDVLQSLPNPSAHDIFGTPDDLKLRSSMTLFAIADPTASAFKDVLVRYYGGEFDPRTVELLTERNGIGSLPP